MIKMRYVADDGKVDNDDLYHELSGCLKEIQGVACLLANFDCTDCNPSLGGAYSSIDKTAEHAVEVLDAWNNHDQEQEQPE